MDYTQLIPLTKGVKVATHTSEDTISYEWEADTAYPFNTVVWYNNTPYISVRNVPDNAGTPDEEPGFGEYYL